MGLDVSKVLTGAPDQKTTGAILDAPLGSKLPTDATTALDKAFTSSGYISEDGLSLSTDRSTNDVKEWGGSNVRKFLESFDATLSWSELQMSYEALCHAFGAAQVIKTPKDTSHGERIEVQISGELPEARSWVFQLKDGNNRVRIVVPNGQITSVDEIAFTANDAVKLPLTLTTYPDASGKNIYIYTDDGLVGAA